MQTHRIRRQRWQVRAPNQETALAWRHELRMRLDSEILPAFERAFEALGLGESVLHIPRLTLDTKATDVEGLIRKLPALIAEQLADALQAGSSHAPAARTVRRFDLDADWRDALLRYLASGHLPWHMAGREHHVVIAALRKQALILADAPSTWPLPETGHTQANLAWLQRLLQLLPEAVRIRLCALRVGDDALSPTTVLVWVARQANMPESHRLRVQALLLSLARSQTSAVTQDHAMTAALGETLSLPEVRKALGTVPPALRAMLASLSTNTFGPAHPPSGSPGPASSAVPPSLLDVPPNIPPTTGPVPQPDTVLEQGLALAVQAAGLVLLHPFLPRFCEATGICRSTDRSIPAERLPRAAALLHWLAWGREEAFEYELGMIKPLLGLAPNDALPMAGGLLRPSDHDEAQTLLSAVIEHWGALGHTTIAGLRVSFLQRQGLLREFERGWQLQVEMEPFDMLLGRLPWGIGVVRLPWMIKTLYIDWPTP